jgi:hypothetical protein
MDESNFTNGTVLKAPKTYLACFDSHIYIGIIVEYLGKFEN